MEFKSGDITAKGHALLAKLQAGGELRLTAAFCGDGDFDGDIWNLESLISPKLKGEIIRISPYPREQYTAVVLRFSNETVTEFFMLREIGIYALDPDEGEILYAYAQAGERANFIEAYNGQWYTEDEITVYIYTASLTSISARIEKTSSALEITYANEKSKLDADNVQEAIDELSCIHVVDATLAHNLGTYPSAIVFEIKYGSGMGPCGETPCGGEGEYRQLNCRAVYVDGNRMMIALGKKYDGTPTVEEIVPGVFILMFESVALRVALQVDYATLNVLTEKRLEKLEEMEALEELRKEFNGLLSTLSAVLDSNAAELAALDKKIDAVPIGCGN